MSNESTPRWYVCMYPHNWGRGHSIEEAKKAAKQAGGSGREWYVKQLPEGVREVGVDGMGAIHWKWPEGWTDAQYDKANATYTMEVVAESREYRRNRERQERERAAKQAEPAKA